MSLDEIVRSWNLHAESDPMWAVLMDPQRDMGRWDPQEFFETGHASIADALHSVWKLHYPLRTGRALDFGCGLGRLTQALACYFDRVDGVDAAPAMVRQARQLNPHGDRCRFHLNQRDDLRLFPDGQFDFIFSIIVLQHIRPAYSLRYVAEFIRLLAPGGLLLFQQPSHYSKQPIDDGYQTRGDRWKTWANATWQKLRRADADRTAPCDYDYVIPKYPRKAPNAANFVPGIRADQPHGGAKAPHAADGKPLRSQDVATTELHLIPRRRMLRHIRRSGGRVLHVAHRVEATPYHPSYRYFVTR